MFCLFAAASACYVLKNPHLTHARSEERNRLSFTQNTFILVEGQLLPGINVFRGFSLSFECRTEIGLLDFLLLCNH